MFGGFSAIRSLASAGESMTTEPKMTDADAIPAAKFPGVSWLLGLCEKAGKGVLNNVDARAVARAVAQMDLYISAQADEIIARREHAKAQAAELTRLREQLQSMREAAIRSYEDTDGGEWHYCAFCTGSLDDDYPVSMPIVHKVDCPLAATAEPSGLSRDNKGE